jgi:hypothetical protein
MPYLPCHYLYISFIYCTCWVPTISVLNPTIFPCYSNLLLRRRRWIGILRWGVLGYVLPRLPFLWCYGVFRYSILLRVILVFKDTIYVIIILYIHDIWLSVSTFGRMCGTINHGSRIWWVLGFGIKTGYDSMPDNGATENNRVLAPKSRSNSWLVTNTTLCHPLQCYPKKGQFRTFTSHMHDTCETSRSEMGDAYVSLLYLRF